MKDFIKQFLDWVSPAAPPPNYQEAVREDMKRDHKIADTALDRLVEMKTLFGQIVDDVVRDVNAERKARHRNEKTTSRSRKT